MVRNIYKADSKGRIAGFDAGQMYWLEEGSGVLRFERVVKQYDVRLPLNEAGSAYFRSFGLNPSWISPDGADAVGYFEFLRGGDGEFFLSKNRQRARAWREWPDGFDYEEFVRLANS